MIPFLAICCVLLAAVAASLAWQLSRSRRRRQEDEAKSREDLARTEKTLESERDAMLNTLNDAFLLIDSEGRILFANEPAQRLFRGREIMRRHFDEVFLHERLAAPVRESLRARETVTREVLLPQQASPLGSEDHRGETAWVVDAGPMDPDRHGNLTRIMIRDNTAEHQTEQVRKDFVANASHELRTPLAIINGYLENLLDDNLVEDVETSRRFLGIMRKHGTRIARIVEDMLMISRLESDEASSLKMKPFSLEGCVQDVVERLESVIASQGARIKLRLSVPGLTILGDRFYWTQILFNLVENALKQNPGLPLKVEIGSCRMEDGTARLWVSDNGVGIPSADLPFIFRRFYRVEKHHSQGQIKGTGLGLSIVKRAVEAHGGEIVVSSTPGQETRFEMVLPVEAVAEKERADIPVRPQ